MASTKHRMPRFGSEQTRETNMIPTLWHKAEEKMHKQTESKLQKSHKKGASKKTKHVDDQSRRADSLTPHVVERSSAERFELDQSNQTSATSGVILAQSHQKQKRFKR